MENNSQLAWEPENTIYSSAVEGQQPGNESNAIGEDEETLSEDDDAEDASLEDENGDEEGLEEDSMDTAAEEEVADGGADGDDAITDPAYNAPQAGL